MPRVNVGRIQNSVARSLKANGSDIVLTWDVWPVDSVPSPVDGGRSGTPTVGTVTLPALVHYVQAAGQSSVRQFNEVVVGDVILDFAQDVDLGGKENLRFSVGGQLYVAKKLSDALAATWDVLVGGQKLFRTVLCRKAT